MTECWCSVGERSRPSPQCRSLSCSVQSPLQLSPVSAQSSILNNSVLFPVFFVVIYGTPDAERRHRLVLPHSSSPRRGRLGSSREAISPRAFERDGRVRPPSWANPTVRPKPSATETLVVLVETSDRGADRSGTETIAETLEPSPTEVPTDTPEPVRNHTATPDVGPLHPPHACRRPTQTFTPAPPPPPECVARINCA